MSLAATTADPHIDPDWVDVVEHSPVACLLLSAERLGDVVHANQEGRDLLGVDTASETADVPTVFDLLDERSTAAANEAFAHLVGNAGQEKLSAEVELRQSGEHARAFTMHLRRQGEYLLIAQFVARDGWDTVNRVLGEQQRFRSVLLELSELAHSTKDDDEFYQRLIERAVEVVPGAQGGSVQLHIEGTESFRFVAAVGYDLAGLQQHTLEQNHFFRDAWDPTARIVREFANKGRTEEITEWLYTIGRLDEIVVNVSAPVLVDGLPVAFLSLDNFEDPDAMSQTTVEMTTVLSRLIGDLWRRRQLEAELRHQALHDPLTQLPNRRNLDRCLSEALELGRPGGHPSAVLFVDIDDFKGVNDRLGHDVGDLLLRGVARGIRSVVRAGDVVGRWGGDEFLILPRRFDTSAEAVDLAERILARFETDLDLDEDGLTYRARLSVGIGWCADSSVDASTLVTAADEALYAAKAAGKGVTRFRNVEPEAA